MLQFFSGSSKETSLTQAVVQNDVEAVKTLSEDHALLQQVNSLGFSPIELAKYLNRKECLEILAPSLPRKFKVRLKEDQKTVILTEQEFEEFFGITYLPHLIFHSYSFFKEVAASAHSLFCCRLKEQVTVTPQVLEQYRDRPEIFALRAAYFRKQIDQGYFAPVRIQWVSDRVEWGVFAEANMKRGDYIGAYHGEVRRFAFWLLQNDHSIVYPNKSWKNFLIDAQTKGNEMRFVNHSFDPNIETLAASDNGLVHVLFVAAKNIAKNEQLTWSYGEDFWERRDPPEEL